MDSKALLLLALAAKLLSAAAQQPNPPVWPSSVKVFSASMSTASIEATIKSTTSHLWGNNGQFSSDRFALLFKPGTYHANVQVGYYTHVMGLGTIPTAVSFTAPAGSTSYLGVYAPAGGSSPDGPGSLVTFWRVAENFYTDPTGQVDQVPTTLAPHMTWAVSQAAPLRRVQVNKPLWLFQLQFANNDWSSIYASGGFLSNVLVTGTGDAGINLGGQQQFYLRNSKAVSPISGGAWSAVFSGVSGAPAATVPAAGTNGVAYTVLATTPVSAEKPFITFDQATGKYFLQVPKTKWGSSGVDFDPASNTAIGFERVFVATPASLNNAVPAKDLQTQLDAGLHVVLTPGIYSLTKPLVLKTTNQVVLGLGLATLVAPLDGSPCVRVRANVFGVRLSGVMLQASAIATTSAQFAQPGSVLLDWGVDSAGVPTDHTSANMAAAAANPNFMHDIFARVGGPGSSTRVNVDTMVRVSASFTVGDNLWLWRADHIDSGLTRHNFDSMGKLVSVDCRCSTGLKVTGDSVMVLGLAVEHTQKDQVIWSGEEGKVLFYQSELPYDVRQDSYFNPQTNSSFLGYNVAGNVQKHMLYGPGVYSYFRDYKVFVETAIKAPAGRAGVKVVNPFTVHLNGNPGLLSVLNGHLPGAFTGYYQQGWALRNV